MFQLLQLTSSLCPLSWDILRHSETFLATILALILCLTAGSQGKETDLFLRGCLCLWLLRGGSMYCEVTEGLTSLFCGRTSAQGRMV